METRRLGRIGHQSSVLIYGAAALGDVPQEVADGSVQEALDAGINHFDVAASYGGAEERLGPWTGELRRRGAFLATKVEERAAEAAWASINRSLERLRIDAVDLLQLHAVGDLETLDAAVSGALTAALRARDEGMVREIGITGHGHQAPATHLEALRRFPFATVLTPLNYRLAQDEGYLRDYEALVDEARRQDAGLMVIKAVSRRPWPGTPAASHAYATWYEPFDDQERITAAVAWALDHEEVTGLATAGDVRLLGHLVRAERERAVWTRSAAETMLADVPDYASPFVGAWA